MKIKILSFNIKGGNNEGPNAWDRRAEYNASVLRRHAPDLLGLQEVTAKNLEFYCKRLPEYGQEYGPETSDSPEYLYEPILWRETAFERLESGGFWLSETPEVFSCSWGSSQTRGASWARLRIKASGLEILHFNTHMDHESEAARREGSRTILAQIERLRRDDQPVIITGDFNSNAYLAGYDVPPETAETSPAYRNFLDYGFIDTFTASRMRDSYASFTYHNYKGAEYWPDPEWAHISWRMDWVMLLDPAQRLRPVSAEILRDHDGELYPSDHYPVMVELEDREAGDLGSENR